MPTRNGREPGERLAFAKRILVDRFIYCGLPEFGHEQVIDLGIIFSSWQIMYAHIHLSTNRAYITLINVTDSDAGRTVKYIPPKGQTIEPDGTAE
jgi:hypothetical protein